MLCRMAQNCIYAGPLVLLTSRLRRLESQASGSRPEQRLFTRTDRQCSLFFFGRGEAFFVFSVLLIELSTR